MAFTFINSYGAGYAQETGNTLTLNKPTNTANGDIMFTFLRSNSTPITSVPSGWTLLCTNNGGGPHRVYYKIASDEPDSYSRGLSTFRITKGTIVTYRGGFNATDPIDVVSNTHYGTENNICRAASMTVSAVNSPLIFFGLGYNTSGVTFTKPSAPTTDWIENYDGGDTGSDIYMEICSMVWTSSGATGDIDATLSTTIDGDKGAFAVALNPDVIPNTGAFLQMF